MPQYLTPGVFVEEVPSGSAPIAGASTSTPGFVGYVSGDVVMPARPGVFTMSGDTPVPVRYTLAAANEPQLVTSWEQFKNTFGDFQGEAPLPKNLSDDARTAFVADAANRAHPSRNGTLAHAVFGFFNNGGSRCWVVRTETELSDRPQVDAPVHSAAATVAAARATAAAGLAAEREVAAKAAPDDTAAASAATQARTDATNAQTAADTAATAASAADPAPTVATAAAREPVIRAALDALRPIDEIALIAVPGVTDPGLKKVIYGYCEEMGDRFAILDGSADPNAAMTKDGTAGAEVGTSNYAAVYYPWIEVTDPARSRRTFVAPSGHVAGVYARVDGTRGVHKAPAAEVVKGATSLQRLVSRGEQDGLNPHGVNIIRNLDGNIKIWGARTLGGDDNGEWKYINVRRTFLYLRKSIDQGTQWAVFEPNTPELWQKIVRNISAFLTGVWRSGALFGVTPQEAFYVRCDASLNPPEVRDLGQVITEIGVSVVRPAEFVIFRISQWAGPGK